MCCCSHSTLDAAEGDLIAMMRRSTLALVVLIPTATAPNCTGVPTTPAGIRRRWLAADYDKDARPSYSTWAAGRNLTSTPPHENIYLNLQLNSLTDVDSRSQTFTAEFFQRVLWYDPRIAYDSNCVPEGEAAWLGQTARNELWTPRLMTPSLADTEIELESAFWHVQWGSHPRVAAAAVASMSLRWQLD
jgi:hypothetical protein